jgi:predicted Rdx family selenoprotein
MKYEMQFCVGCYLSDALALARSIMEGNPHDENFSLSLVPGESGSFDIKKDGLVVYSKKASGRMPAAQDLGLAASSTAFPVENTARKCC